MPGDTKDIGTVKARIPRQAQDEDFSKEYPGLKIVLVSKTAKVSDGMMQTTAYEYEGYKFLRASAHPDLLVYGMAIEDWEELVADQNSVNAGVVPGLTRGAPVSRQELHSYGVPNTED